MTACCTPGLVVRAHERGRVEEARAAEFNTPSTLGIAHTERPYQALKVLQVVLDSRHLTAQTFLSLCQ